MIKAPQLPERYIARGPLGEGATGVVWWARDQALDIEVALKIVFPNLARLPRFRARFAREVALSASVIHPRVVPVHDHGQLPDGRPFVALAYADRGSLGDMLKARPSLLEVIRLIDQVLDALGALHVRGIVHQDLKPGNVLIYGTPDGGVDAWVADLGVAGALGELAMDGHGLSGTPAWMAPEQLDGRVQELGPWTDLYAVGLLLYELLGGERVGDDVQGLRVPRQLERPLRLPGEPPRRLVEIVRNLLDSDPRQRYDRAADVRRALKGAVAGIDPEMPVYDVDDWPTATTTFAPTILPEAQQTVSIQRHAIVDADRVLRWNRVPPGPMPRRPPPEDPGLSRVRASQRLFAMREPALVAREGLRRSLWKHARQVVRYGEPVVVILVGRSGSGKSRIVESVARELDQGGYMEAIYLRYNNPAGGDDGYRGAVRELLAPWSDTRAEAEQRLARWLARDQQVPVEAVVDEAAVLARWCGYVGTGEGPVNAGVGLVHLYRHLDARSWRGGACLVLEDVHNAEAEGDGLSVCEALLERAVGQRPVLAMATITEESIERSPELAAKVAALERMGAIRISAPRFSDADMRLLLGESLRLESALAEDLLPLCKGSPTVATMMLRDWAARGMLTRGEGFRFSLREGVRVADEVPASLDQLCERRMRGAIGFSEDPEAVEMVLAATALAGQGAPVQVIRELNHEGLDALLATGIVRQATWRLVFEHSGIARAARHMALLREDVDQIHGALADAWEKLGRFTGIDVDLPLGTHRLRSGASERAVTPLLRLCRTALQEGRPGLALDAGRLAEMAAEQANIPMARTEARQHQIEALLDLDRAETARRVLEDTLRLGRIDRLSEARLRSLDARAAVALGDLVRARKNLNRAAATFEATRDRRGMVETAHGEAILYRIEGRADKAADRYARMLRINKRLDPRTEVLGLVGLVESRLGAGRVSGAQELLERLRAVARESGDTRNIAQAVYASGLVSLRMRHLEEAERFFATGRALAATLGDDRLRIACEYNLGEEARYRGDVRAAEGAYERAARLAETRGWSTHSAVARLNLSLVYLQKGAKALATVQIDRADHLLQEQPQHWGWLYIGVMRSLWAAEKGDEATCRAWWAVAHERGIEHKRTPDLWIPLERLSTAVARQGWTDLARRVNSVAHRHGDPHHAGRAEVSIEEE